MICRLSHTAIRALWTAGQRLVCMGFWIIVLSVPCWATLYLEAPERAPQGAAVAVGVVADSDAPVTLVWRELRLPVPLVATVGSDGRTQWHGKALLPMPLEGSKTLPLRAETAHAHASTAIRPLKVAWPRQKISVESKYVAPPKAVQARIAREQTQVRALLDRTSAEQFWALPCARPVPGTVSSAFGGQRIFNGTPKSRHRGVDLRGASGTPILAMAAGRVAIAEEHYFSGNVVYLDHGQGIVSLYAHMSEIQVAPGQMVTAGQQIGLVGATGRVTGPHLHWGVNIMGKPVNPLSLVPQTGPQAAPQANAL